MILMTAVRTELEKFLILYLYAKQSKFSIKRFLASNPAADIIFFSFLVFTFILLCNFVSFTSASINRDSYIVLAEY